MLLALIVPLVIVGLILWVLTQIPMDPTIARIIRVVVIIFVVLWLLQILTGVFGSINLMGPLRRP